MRKEIFENLEIVGANLGTNKNYKKEQEYLFKKIEKFLFEDDTFAYNSYLQNAEIFKFNFNNEKTIDIMDEFKFIKLLQRVCSVFFKEKSENYEYYIFEEVNQMINFIYKEINYYDFFKTYDKKYKIKDFEYHKQVQMIKYIYSVLDKIINLVENLVVKKIDPNLEFKQKNILKDFVKIALPLIKDKTSEKKLKEVLLKIDKSNLYHYLRKLRNSFEHNFVNPNIDKNFSLEINMMFIMVFYIYTNIVINLKSDDEIFAIINN